MVLHYGTHISISKSLYSNLLVSKEILDCNSFQIFTKSPIKYGKIGISQEDMEQSAKFIKENKIYLVIHGQYIINFCKYVPWAIESLAQDMLFLENFVDNKNLPTGVIIHMGKDTIDVGEDICIDNFISCLDKTIEKVGEGNTNIILETSVKSKNDKFYKIENLAKLYHKLNTNTKKRVKFCIDTCHIFSSGYNISIVSGMKDYFDNFDKLIGIKNIAVIHLNDSKNKVDSGLDRHESIGKGHIFGENMNSLRYLIQLAKNNNIPIITETNTKNKTEELNLVYNLSLI